MDLFGNPEPEKTIEEEIIEESSAVAEDGQGATPRTATTCRGHEMIEAQLLDLHKSARMPHGLVFAGPKGIGKATTAYRLTRFLLKNDPAQTTLTVDPKDPTFRRVASGGHPDLLTAERAFDDAKGREKSSLDVDTIRKVAPFLRMTSSNGGWRVVIIDDADTMNRNAQNALLKILEEPPRHAMLILVTHRPGALIPTIRSRTRTINFQPLSADTMKDLLRQKHPALTMEDIESINAFAEGSIGKALQYIDDGGLEILGTILDTMNAYPAWRWSEIHKLADRLAGAGSEQSYDLFQQLLPWVFDDLARRKARGQGPESAQNQTMQEILRNSSLEHLLKICENLHSHFGRIQAANLDKRSGIIGAFSLIAA